MKLLKTVSLAALALILTQFASANSDLTWGEIAEDMTLKPKWSSATNPQGASLNNVCEYSATEFRVINPQSVCLNYETVMINPSGGGKPGDGMTVQRCTDSYTPEMVVLPNTYTKCTDWKVTQVGTKKDGYTKSTCVAYSEPMAVPTTQTIDVYLDRKNYSKAFEKEFTVPSCDDIDFGTVEPVPPKKN